MDQCEFDELSNMLEDVEGQDKVQKPADSTNDCSQNMTNNNSGFMSSDDDIDDDELDMLAMAVEADQKASIEEQTKSSTSKTHTAQSHKEKPCETVVTQASPVLHSEVTSRTKSPQVPVKPQPALKESETVNVELKLSELQAMQEQIEKLKAELQKHTSPPEPVQSTSATQQTSTKIDQTSTQKEPKYKLITSDIFGAENSSTPSPSRTSVGQRSSPSTSSRKADKPKSAHTPKPKTKPADKSNHAGREAGVAVQQDSDSDWEGMDGEKPSQLSGPGKEVKKLLTMGPRDRVAHSSNFSTEDLEEMRKKKPYGDTWRKKPAAAAAATASPSSYAEYKSQISGSNQADKGSNKADKDVFHERFSGIRILNPLVSSANLQSLMDGRKMIQMSRLLSKVNTSDLDSDWVTIGVITSKTDPKKSQKGNQYSIWRLSDLEDCEKVVSFFLFKNVFSEHWKTLSGSVIGLLNPNVMSKEEKGNPHEVSITIDNPKKMLLMGKSGDLGKCKSITKGGSACSNFVNIQRGEFCTYHVQSAYKKSSNKRAELQAGYNGVVPKQFDKKFFSKGGTVMYGGQSFSTTGHTNTKPKKNISVGTLQQHYNSKVKGNNVKVTTLQLHDILPEDEEVLNKVASGKKDKNEKFHEALTFPTAGSMNLVKHLLTQEKGGKEKEKATPQYQSVSAKDLLMKHEVTMKQKREARIRQKSGTSPAADSPKPGAPPSLGRGLAPGSDLFFDLDSPAPTLPKKPVNRKNNIKKKKVPTATLR